MLKDLQRDHGDVNTYLFGSFAEGTWLEDNDVDILVVSERSKDESMPERINGVRRLGLHDMAFEIQAYNPDEPERASKY